MKTPEDIIKQTDGMLAAFDKEQADFQAEIAKLEAMQKDYPPILRACIDLNEDALTDAVKKLLAAGEDPNVASPFGETPLGVCFRNGAFEALRLLIEAGADTGEFQWSEAHRAVAVGEVPNNVDPMVRDAEGRTLFLLACRVANLNAAKALLPQTPPEGSVDSDGEGPVSVTVRSRDVEMVSWTLEQGFDVNARARFGGTALIIAAEMDDVAIAKRLLEAGADLTLTDNISASLAADEKDPPKKKSVFAKAADKIIASMPKMYEMADTLNTPASCAYSSEMARLLMQHGADIRDFDSEMVPAATGADLLAEVPVTLDDFDNHGTARAGNANPEAYLPNFWHEQIRTGRSGYSGMVEVLGDYDYDSPAIPVWSFDRFGRTATPLPDGRLVLIAGEHEDYYDSDFCIYADVTVLDGKGGVEHFIYPADIFPPTDFHTATLVGDHIWLIGALGYRDHRFAYKTQVLRLNLADFSIDAIKTTGDNPGWVNHHTAMLDGHYITVAGGNTGLSSVDNFDSFVLDLKTLDWSRVL